MPQVQLNTRLSIETHTKLKDYAKASGKSLASIIEDALVKYLEEAPTMYNKDTFKEMIHDWQADNAPEYDTLEITEISKESNQWIAYANDKKTTYTLTDDGTGNIAVNYLGTK